MLVQFTIPQGSKELTQATDVCIARCVERWRGCTVTRGDGWWIPPTMREYVSEPVAILGVECESAHGRSTSDAGRESHRCVAQGWFDNLATYVREKGNQHTVYYRMFDGGEARFVGPETITAPQTMAEVYGGRGYSCEGCGK